MIKISDVIEQTIETNSFLKFGMHSRLLNLSQVARYLKPIIEVRLSKSVTDSAILMSLSRLQRKYPSLKDNDVNSIPIENLVIQTNLCVLSYSKKNKIRQEINKFYNKVQSTEGYITLTEGISEVSIIFDKTKYKLARTVISDKPVFKRMDVAALGVKFRISDIETKGLYFSIFQEIFIQGISLVEIASAATELILFMEEKDFRLAFDTLYNRVRQNRVNTI